MAINSAGGTRLAFESPTFEGHLSAAQATRQGAVFFVIAAIALLAPKSLHTLLPALFGYLLLELDLSGRRHPNPRILATDFGTVVFLALGVFVVARAVTAPDPGRALAIVAACASYLAMTHAIIARVTAADADCLTQFRRAAFLSVLLGAAYLVVEFVSGLALVTGMLNALPALAGETHRHYVMRGDTIEAVRDYVLNRNVGVLNLVLWPALLIAATEATHGRSLMERYAAGALFALAGVATFLSSHDSSKVALVAGSASFLASRVSLRFGRALVAIAWIVANVGVLGVVQSAYHHDLQSNTHLPGSARARIVIWNYTASQIGDTFVFGKGIDSARYYDEIESPNAIWLPGELSPQRTGRHPHNAYLQVWYELGALGVLLVMTSGLLLLRRLDRVGAAALPYAHAAFASAMTIAAFSWSLWQHWYFAGMCFTAILVAVAAAPLRRAASPSAGS